MQSNTQKAIETTIRHLAQVGAASRNRSFLARCPAAERIVAANQPTAFLGGAAGAMQFFLAAFDPRLFKRKAAQAIIALRQNRAVLREQGRSHSAADAYWLNRAAHCRREAARLSK